MNFKLRLLALLLVVMMMFTSCSIDGVVQYVTDFIGQLQESQEPEVTATTPQESTTLSQSTGPITPEEPKWSRKDHSINKKEMEARYTLTREEVDATLALIAQMVEGALPDPEGDQTVGRMTVEEVDAIYLQFEEAFYHTAQQMTIASIIYYCDMKDEVATQRHLDTQDMFYEIQDAYNEGCREMYLHSPYAAEFFDGWSEDEIQALLDFDPTTTALKKEVEELTVEFNNLGASAFYDGAAEYYAKIVEKNNELASFYGYDNYYDYATENIYNRDYTKEELEKFRSYIKSHIIDRCNNLYSGFMAYRDLSTTRYNQFLEYVDGRFDDSKKNYLLLYLDSLGDTNMGVAMRDVFDSKNCIFAGSSNSHPSAFQTYLYEDETPFCLFGNSGQSASTMVHEIGHYYAAYTNKDLSNYDLCETHSQGNEFLFLQFCKEELPSKVYTVSRYYALFNAYYIIVVATIIDDFEQRVYSLDSVEGYTSADFDAIMDEVIADYGKTSTWFETYLTDIYKYWRNVAVENPVYYISYAVSAVVAVELFAIAESDVEGEGYEAAQQMYITLVEGVTEEDGFLSALKKAGLYTPFEEEAHKKVSATMRK